MTDREIVLRGFTLIELMLVVAIIGLLAAIALPKFANLVIKAKEASMRGKLSSLRSALSIYYADNEGAYPLNVWAASHSFDYFLIPKYMDQTPSISNPTQPDHRESNGVTGSMGLTCVGAWVPMGWPWGAVAPGPAMTDIIILCSHTDSKGIPWSLY